MLRYHFFIAWKSLRRTPGNTLLIVAGIALGVAVATLFSTIRHSFARDPIPEKSSVLHYVRMDSADPRRPSHFDSFPSLMTYRDMVGVMKSDIPIRQTGSFYAQLEVSPRTEQGRPRKENVRVCHADFFAMFNVPFRYGSAWDRNADDKTEPVVVLGEELNHQWFGGEDSVGRLVSIGGRDFRIVGVLAHWRPAIKFYDLYESPLLLPEAMFIPMSLIRPMAIWPPRYRWNNWQIITGDGNEGLLAGEAYFIQMWVELPGPREVAAYRSFLDSHAMEQRRIGRFVRPLVTPLLEHMRERGCVPPEATAMMIAADLFLTACALSLMGLLMARFLARAPEIGVRRALGARRWDIFVQHVIECEVMALAGGLLGFALASAGLWFVSFWYKAMTPSNRDDVFRMDLAMASFAAMVSLAAGLLAGVYPAHRVCRIAPASHLKIQ